MRRIVILFCLVVAVVGLIKLHDYNNPLQALARDARSNPEGFEPTIDGMRFSTLVYQPVNRFHTWDVSIDTKGNVTEAKVTVSDYYDYVYPAEESSQPWTTKIQIVNGSGKRDGSGFACNGIFVRTFSGDSHLYCYQGLYSKGLKDIALLFSLEGSNPGLSPFGKYLSYQQRNNNSWIVIEVTTQRQVFKGEVTELIFLRDNMIAFKDNGVLKLQVLDGSPAHELVQ
jgi:hypothetical protein